MGIGFDRMTEAQTVRYIVDQSGQGKGGWVITSNLDHLRRATRDADFREMLHEADLVVADGMPLVWASRLSGAALPERVAGSSMAWSLTAAAAERGLSVFLLGGDPGAADQAAAVLLERHPELRIAGTHCPPMGFENDGQEMARILAMLRETEPDLVYVALGSPKQEKLIQAVRDVLPGAWWIGVGISLSFICGQVKRAPRWVQTIGMEWLHRMLQEPRRLARRYLVDGIPFAFVLMGNAIKSRFRRG